MSVHRIENVLGVNFRDYVFLGWGLSIRQRNTSEANPGHLWCLHLLVEVPNLLHFIQRHINWLVLRSTVEKYCLLRRTKCCIGLFSAIYFAPKKYGWGLKSTFCSRITFTRFVMALQKFSTVWPFDMAVQFVKSGGKRPSKPALETLRTDMRAPWMKNVEIENWPKSAGLEQSKFPSADVSAWGPRSCLPSCRRLLPFWFWPRHCLCLI